jgi:purine-binding chemotaxis protein CheW
MDVALKTEENKILVFTLDESACALLLSNVVRVIHAIEIRKLPKAPGIVKGIINVNVEIIPVFDIRKRFGHQSKEVEADDRIIIANTGKRKVAFFADTVSGVEELESTQYESITESLSFADYVKGVAKVKNEMILIHDLEQFLNIDEEKGLEEALLAKTT